jgi:murein DD-endopeptidase MepM/ murein hydrolase activator NlpD
MYPRINKFRNKSIINNPTNTNIVLVFTTSLYNYVYIRSRQIVIWGYAGTVVIVDILSDIKSWFIRRMFWGRSSLYRSAFHTFVSVVTLIAMLTGISNRLNFTAASEEGLDITSGAIGRQDFFSQLGTAESIGAIGQDEKDYPEYIYTVDRGDTLSKVAALFQINVSTIKWANGLTSETLKVGQVLRIPGIDGAFIKVAKNDTLESIASKHKGNVADILDLNSHILDPRNPVLREGMELFIPGGVIPTPPPVVRRASPVSRQPNNSQPVGGIDVPSGTFVHPLGSECSGWSWSRGFTAWHGGADMAKRGGCWINAAGNGTVTYAGWSNGGQGYNIRIDHDNGFSTLYYHGNGQFAVKSGDYVRAGQRVMYMGTTGNSTGVHLHFEVRVNNVKQNPERYIKLR